VEVLEQPILDHLELDLTQADLEVQEEEVAKIMEEEVVEMLEDIHHQKEMLEEVQDLTDPLLFLEEEVVEQVELEKLLLVNQLGLVEEMVQLRQ
jgi:hypothetical protein